MTINLEHVGDGSIADRNFQRLRELVPDTGGQSLGIRFGTTNVTFTAATLSAAVATNHGLGRTPAVVVGSARNAAIVASLYISSATQITIQAWTTPALSGTFAVHWVVIG